MKLAQLIVLFTLLSSPSARAEQSIQSRASTETFITHSIDSKGAARGEAYRVILPKGYAMGKKYPVVYFLHGLGDSMQMLERLGAIAAMDQLVDSGKTPFILVSPNGGSSYWMNGASNGEKWEDMVVKELISDFEGKYPASYRAGDRIIAGISMGGSSAVRIALDHPDIYSAIGAHSPIFRDETAAREFIAIFGQGSDYRARDPFSLMSSGKTLPGPIRIDAGNKNAVDSNGRARLFAKQFAIPECEQHFEDTGGGHDDSYWSRHLPEYFAWYSKVFTLRQSGISLSAGSCL